MESQKTGIITRRLILSFCLLILIFLIFGLFTFYGIRSISSLTRTIYDHPLVVSNAALQANVSITKMHRNMKDVVIFESQKRIQESINFVNQEERQAYNYLDIVKNRILGEEGKQLENEARTLFDSWRPIREEVISLVHMGQRDEAAHITVGKGADHVAELEGKMLGLTDYARKKATLFMGEAEKMHSRLNATSILFLLSATIISSLIAFLTLNRTAEAEQILNESEERFRSISSSVNDALITLDNDGNITFWNDAAETIFGYNIKEVLGKKLHKLLSPVKYLDAYKKGLNIFKETGEGDAIGRTIELSALRKDGTEFPIELSLASYHANGRWHAVGTVRDISDRKWADQERESLILDLKKALKEVKQLSGLLPICSICKKIRDDKGYWKQIEEYIRDHTEAEFSHGICQECAKNHYPDLDLNLDL